MSRQSSNRGSAPLLWCLFAVLLFSAASLRVWQNHQRRVDHQLWQGRCQQIDVWGKEAKDRVWALYRAAEWPNAMPRSEVERELNDGKPLSLMRNGDRDIAIWTDARSGRRFELKFRNDRWSGVGTRSGAGHPPAPTPSTFDAVTEGIRARIAGWNRGWGPLLWLVLLVLCLSSGRHRRLLGQLLLGTALVCFTAWLVAPKYSLTPSGIFSNDMLFWGTLMLASSVTMIAWAVIEEHRRRRSGLLCPNCEYSLRANVTGKCPECGCHIPQDLRLRVQVDGGPATS